MVLSTPNNVSNEFILLPNPATKETTINLGQTITALHVNILNLNGQLVSQHNYEFLDQINLDIGLLPQGIYIIKLIGGDINQIVKLIKH